MMMITRKVGQKIFMKIGEHNIVLVIVDAKGTIVRLGLMADSDVKVEFSLDKHLKEVSDVDRLDNLER